MRRLSWVFLFYFTGHCLFAQQDLASVYGDQISADHIRDYLSILASDALEGRETGKRGQKMAAALISSHFDEIGLQGPVAGSHYQHFNLYTDYPDTVYLKNDNIEYRNFDKIAYYGKGFSGEERVFPVVFGKDGSASTYDAVDPKGKAVLIILAANTNASDAVSTARAKGAPLVIVANASSDDEFASFATGLQDLVQRQNRLSLNPPEPQDEGGVLYVAPSVASAIMHESFDDLKKDAADSKIRKKEPTGNITIKASGYRTVVTENVLGYLEGTDKKDELVVVTAHYDHIGKLPGTTGDLINNGADDDGSGTSAVMELARVFAKARDEGHGPRRSMLFMTFTGEEKGLLGSDYYTQHPVFPLANTVVDLNIDMIGRRDPQHADSSAYVYIIGSDKLSMDLHHLSEAMNNQYTHLKFDYTYNDPNHPDRLYYRSDHWNFAKNNIPIIFYFDGIHADYHKPSDEIDKIDFNLLTQRARCVFYTAWTIANRDDRLVIDKEKMITK